MSPVAKLFRLIILASQAIMIQFLHVFGLVAFVVAALFGYFRLPSWTIIFLTIGFAVIADKFVDEAEVSGILEKAAAASERGGFLIIVYFLIAFAGYLVGAYVRHHLAKKKAGALAAPTDEAGK